MVLEIMEREVESSRQRWRWPGSFKALFLALFRRLEQWVGLKVYCHRCQAELELVDEQHLESSTPLLVRGVRIWRCPMCAEVVRQPFAYFEDMEAWFH